MFGKPVGQLRHQRTADGYITLRQQPLNLVHRLQHRRMLVNVALARRVSLFTI